MASKKVKEQVVINGNPLETEEEEFFSWQSEERLFKKRGKEFYSTVVVLALLISVIMFFIEGLMPVFLIWAVMFMIWALSKTPPGKVRHKLTSWGIRTEESLYRWEEMIAFWFEEKWGRLIMRVLLGRRFPGQLMMVVERKDQEKIKKIVSEYVRLEKPESTWTDRTAKWFSEKVPLEEAAG